MSFLSSLLDLLFPPKCVFCGKITDDSADSHCVKCAGKLPMTNNGGRSAGDFFNYCVSPLYYEDDVRKSILRFKFKGSTYYAGAYGMILAACIARYVSDRYDLITWVPLSEKRRRTRGYDQAMLIALAAAGELGCEAAETLRKARDTPAQSEITALSERRANIMGAYRVADPSLVEGKSLLLIDDVITSGSTLSECSRVLLAAGADKIICATLARAG
ncbi:MAG: double zinc ribbon domain-containing protein [Oscillospiraceae bacterium]|jgi:ComF family protein|nr:double zinc ribbon domain-containing protein [Oscillospiraceae bacterium]